MSGRVRRLPVKEEGCGPPVGAAPGVGTGDVGGEPMGEVGGDRAGRSCARSENRCHSWVTLVVAQALSVRRVRLPSHKEV